MSVARHTVDELWSLLDTPTIDPGRLVAAVEAAVVGEDLDWRTRQLIGEAWRAVRGRVGPDELARSLTSHDPNAMQALVDRVFAGHDPAEIKFPSLPDRLEFGMKPASIRQYLTALGKTVDRPITLTLGNSAALILRGLLVRHTDDLDLADEVPAEIRAARETLSELTLRFGLRLAHFQTHYLPPGWAGRTSDGGSYGSILLRLIDPYDIIAGKVFSARARDQDDVRIVSRRLGKDRLLERVHEYAASVWETNVSGSRQRIHGRSSSSKTSHCRPARRVSGPLLGGRGSRRAGVYARLGGSLALPGHRKVASDSLGVSTCPAS